jgi:hypothetical protein
VSKAPTSSDGFSLACRRIGRRRRRTARRSLAAASRASLLEVSGYLFSAIEKPGRQSLVARPELDEERAGGFLGPPWVVPSRGEPARRDGRWADARRCVLTRETDSGGRSVGGPGVAARRTRDGYGFGADAEAQGSAGTTDERF